jgi:hypothetical protein
VVTSITPKVKADGVSTLVTTLADDFVDYIYKTEGSPFQEPDVPDEDEIDPNADLPEVPEV